MSDLICSVGSLRGPFAFLGPESPSDGRPTFGCANEDRSRHPPMDPRARPDLTPEESRDIRKIVARLGPDGSLILDGLPSLAERERLATGTPEPDPLSADLGDAEREAGTAECDAATAIEADAPEEEVAALLARSIRRSAHADDLRRARQLTRRAHLPARRPRCGARARAARPGATRTRGSRRASPSRSGPDDDSGEPEPPRRPAHDLSHRGGLR